MTVEDANQIDERMLQRIHAEFLEMPGLRLTSAQAQRLWGLDEQRCLALLETLVEARFLCRPGRDGAYSRRSEGYTEYPPRMSNADRHAESRRV